MNSSLNKKSVISPKGASPLDSNLYNSFNPKKITLANSSLNYGTFNEKVNSQTFDKLNGKACNILIVYKSFKKLIIIVGLKIHKGPFHVNSISNKNPKYLMSEIIKAIEQQKIFFRNVSFKLIFILI